VLKMKGKNFIIVGICIFLVLIQARADKVIDVNLIVYENDTVEERHVIITEGRATGYYREGGDYELRALDSDKNSIWSQRLNILFGYHGPVVLGMEIPPDEEFNSYLLSFRIPYREEMSHLELLHGTETIFSKEIAGCNSNGVCDGLETYYSCPQDCSSGSEDKVCVKYRDGVCDPDCAEGVDPDCELDTTIPTTLPITLLTTLPTTIPITTLPTTIPTTTIRPEEKEDIDTYLPYLLGAIILTAIILLIRKRQGIKRNLKEKEEEEKLREWVESQLKVGEDPELLKKALEREGSDPAIVDEVIERL